MSLLVATPVSVRERRGHGFTLVELLAVIAVIAILASLILPVLASSKGRAQGAFCLNNTRQLHIAWNLYADDSEGRLPYNFGVGSAAKEKTTSIATPDMSDNWADNVLTWGLEPDNTNSAKLIQGGIGEYMNGATRMYRCPSDYALHSTQSQAGWTARVRSYSMNAMVGDAGKFTSRGVNENNPDYVQFFRISDIPRPSEIFVFVDEHPDSIDDGYFLNRAKDHEWHDLPASYHNNGASFVFADGHAEMHRWRYPSTRPPSRPYAAELPIQPPKGQYGDFAWVISRMSISLPQSGLGY